METLLLFLLKITLWMAAFGAIYRIFLHRETFYIFNRYFLLAGLLLPLVLPLLSYSYTVVIEVPASTGAVRPAAGPVAEEPLSGWALGGLVLYGLGVAFLLVRNGVGLVRIRRLIRQSERERRDGYDLIHSATSPASFSVFNSIILGWAAAATNRERQLILEHEQAHVRQKHWIDLLVAQLVCVGLWFNPLSWLFLRAIRQNHEYLADDAVLKNGHSAAVYKATLINQSLGVPALALTSAFAPGQPLSRIRMMGRPASSGLKKLATLLLFPLLGGFLWAFAEPEYRIREIQPPQKPAPEIANEINGTIPLSGRELPAVTEATPARPVRTKSIVPKPEKIQPTNEITLSRPVQPSPGFVMRDSSVTVRVRTDGQPAPIYVVDGQLVEDAEFKRLNSDDIEAISVYKGEMSVALYGEKGRPGAIVVTTKKKTP